ncbi:MAG: adenine phosphoribosyltransferase [Thermodesulfobacteriota bacterium]
MLDPKALIRSIPDFPKPGIVFRDITPLLAHGPAWQETVNRIAEHYRGRIDIVLGIESRGFLIGSAIAYALGHGIAVVRKPGKLPAATLRTSYALEYGSDALEIHQDAFAPGSRVLVVDDLLATGGTAEAAISLVRQLGGRVVEAAFIIELTFLGGRQRLAPCEVFSLVQYDSE